MIEKQRPVLFFSYPRCTTNLFTHMLNLKEQTDVISGPWMGGYHFGAVGAYVRQQGLFDIPKISWKEEQKGGHRAALEECFVNFENARLQGEAEGRPVFMKEHISNILDTSIYDAYVDKQQTQGPYIQVDTAGSTRSPRNWTIFSDEYLSGWSPLFVIRHPLKVFPSALRAAQWGWGKDLKESPRGGIFVFFELLRELYDLYCTLPGFSPTCDGRPHLPGEFRWPIILDADDYLQNPALLKRVAEAAGLDASKVQSTWDAVPVQERPNVPGAENMLKTLLNSTGVETDKLAHGLSLDGERPKWIEEFGEEQAKLLEEKFHAALPHYNYLYSKRMLP